MKSLLLFTSIVLLLFSCEEPPKEQPVKIDKIEAEIPEEDTFPYDTLQGMYMGDFGGSQIRIVMNYVSGTNAIGYNLHKGLQRNMTGKVSRSGDSIQVLLAEPGDHKYDGVFTIQFNGIDAEPTGVWNANDSLIASKSFSLKKIVKSETKSTSEEITLTNFADVFDLVTDSIGEYRFESDGLVVLKYYDEAEDWDMQQYKELTGSWELDGDKLTLLWEPNTIFKGNRLDLTIMRSEYDVPYLKANDHHELWMMYW